MLQLNSPKPIKSPSNSIRYNCQKICNRSKRPKTTLEKKPYYLSFIDQQAYYLHDLINYKKRPTGQQFLAVYRNCNNLNYRNH